MVTNEQLVYCVLKEHTLTEKEQLMLMAEFKDKQFAQQKQELINKAVDWLKNNIDDYYMTNEFEEYFDEMFVDFKEAMKD